MSPAPQSFFSIGIPSLKAEASTMDGREGGMAGN